VGRAHFPPQLLYYHLVSMALIKAAHRPKETRTTSPESETLLLGNPPGHGDAPLARGQAGKAAAPGHGSSITAALGGSDTSPVCRSHRKDQVFQANPILQGIKMGETLSPRLSSLLSSGYHLSAVMDAGTKRAGGLILL